MEHSCDCNCFNCLTPEDKSIDNSTVSHSHQEIPCTTAVCTVCNVANAIQRTGTTFFFCDPCYDSKMKRVKRVTAALKEAHKDDSSKCSVCCSVGPCKKRAGFLFCGDCYPARLERHGEDSPRIKAKRKRKKEPDERGANSKMQHQPKVEDNEKERILEDFRQQVKDCGLLPCKFVPITYAIKRFEEKLGIEPWNKKGPKQKESNRQKKTRMRKSKFRFLKLHFKRILKITKQSASDTWTCCMNRFHALNLRNYARVLNAGQLENFRPWKPKEPSAIDVTHAAGKQKVALPLSKNENPEQKKNKGCKKLEKRLNKPKEPESLGDKESVSSRKKQKAVSSVEAVDPEWNGGVPSNNESMRKMALQQECSKSRDLEKPETEKWKKSMMEDPVQDVDLTNKALPLPSSPTKITLFLKSAEPKPEEKSTLSPALLGDKTAREPEAKKQKKFQLQPFSLGIADSLAIISINPGTSFMALKEHESLTGLAASVNQGIREGGSHIMEISSVHDEAEKTSLALVPFKQHSAHANNTNKNDRLRKIQKAPLERTPARRKVKNSSVIDESRPEDNVTSGTPVHTPLTTQSCSDSDDIMAIAQTPSKKRRLSLMEDKSSEARLKECSVELERVDLQAPPACEGQNPRREDSPPPLPRWRDLQKKIRAKQRLVVDDPRQLILGAGAAREGRSDSESDIDFHPSAARSSDSSSDSTLSNETDSPSSLSGEDSDAFIESEEYGASELEEEEEEKRLRREQKLRKLEPVVIVKSKAEVRKLREDRRQEKKRCKQRKKIREEYVASHLGHLPFRPVPLDESLTPVTKQLWWDRFPFGAKHLGKMTIKIDQLGLLIKGKKEPKEWRIRKRKFVLRHFREAFRIQKDENGKWICCKNRAEFLDCKAYLKLFWNITIKQP